MNAEFAGRIASYFEYGNWSNVEIAKRLKINKNTVASIRKIYRDIRWERQIDVKKVAKKHHISNNVAIAIHKEARKKYG